ncbi:unnamed protein product [Larinioides sclopetarius]|uniref:Uncharacterized protein n=1 Tax=Larinioides sclopetarius TaxID=280406 RepID=A0AAV2BVG8_9ARAC
MYRKISQRRSINISSLPKDEIRRKLWEKQLRPENFISNNNTRIC